MNRVYRFCLVAVFVLIGCTPPPAAHREVHDSPWVSLAELAANAMGIDPRQPREPSPFVLVGTGYFFSTEYCRYFYVVPMIPKGMRAIVTIEDDENPTGIVEVFVTSLNDFSDPTKANPRPPGTPKTTMNGNGTTSVVGPGMLTLHLANNRPPPRIRVEFEN